jgi:hypothetical protein
MKSDSPGTSGRIVAAIKANPGSGIGAQSRSLATRISWTNARAMAQSVQGGLGQPRSLCNADEGPERVSGGP